MASGQLCLRVVHSAVPPRYDQPPTPLHPPLQVGVAPGSFDSRKALPTPWKGLRDADLRWACWRAAWQAAPAWACSLRQPALVVFTNFFLWVFQPAHTPAATPRPSLRCSAASGIPGGVFVHMSGFIGGNATLEGALAMAAKALDME